MFTRNWYVINPCYDTIYNGNLKTSDYYYYLKNMSGNFFAKHSNFGGENNGKTSINAPTLYNLDNHPKKNVFASEFYVNNYTDMNNANSLYMDNYGVVFGNGTEPESIDSYCMSGEIFTTYTVSASRSISINESGATQSITYTITNTGTEDFTISEIGMIGCGKVTKRDEYYAYYNNFLTERTLLETPITIPANGGVGQVTYTFKFDIPN